MTALFASALLGLAAAATPAPAAALPAGPWVVVQTDGARVRFAAPPVLRAGRWIGRMQGTGTLVSIPASRVDDRATRRANDPGAQAAKPAPRAVPTPRPYETPPLGERAKLKTSGEEASRILEGARKGTPAPRPSISAAPEEGTPPADDVPVDRHGRGEAWWRERGSAVREEIEEADRSLAEAQARLEAAESDYLGPSEGERNSWSLRVQAERDRVEAARREQRRAAAAWDDLQEEARKAGAFPGWLR